MIDRFEELREYLLQFQDGIPRERVMEFYLWAYALGKEDSIFDTAIRKKMAEQIAEERRVVALRKVGG